MAGAVPGHPSVIRKLVLALVSHGGLPGSSCVRDMGLISGGNVHMFPGSANLGPYPCGFPASTGAYVPLEGDMSMSRGLLHERRPRSGAG